MVFSKKEFNSSIAIFAALKDGNDILQQNSPLELKKTIFLIRHGETDYNLKGIVQGSGVDTDLNETGKKQAELFFNSYKNHPFDHIYVSNLKRTWQSVEPFSRLGHKKTVLPELNEINWGTMEGVAPDQAMKLEFQRIISLWSEGVLDHPASGGETPLQLIERQKRGLEIVESRTNESNILVCMHGRAMRSFLCLLTGHPLNRMDDFGHSNLCLYVLEKSGPDYTIKTFNDTKHLF